jgi:hypothetical protein
MDRIYLLSFNNIFVCYSSSSFGSFSDEEENPFCEQNRRQFTPLYRKEHGGIVIYSMEGEYSPPNHSSKYCVKEVKFKI